MHDLIALPINQLSGQGKPGEIDCVHSPRHIFASAAFALGDSSVAAGTREGLRQGAMPSLTLDMRWPIVGVEGWRRRLANLQM